MLKWYLPSPYCGGSFFNALSFKSLKPTRTTVYLSDHNFKKHFGQLMKLLWRLLKWWETVDADRYDGESRPEKGMAALFESWFCLYVKVFHLKRVFMALKGFNVLLDSFLCNEFRISVLGEQRFIFWSRNPMKSGFFEKNSKRIQRRLLEHFANIAFCVQSCS